MISQDGARGFRVPHFRAIYVATVVLCTSAALGTARPSGFLDPDFVHDVVTPDERYEELLRGVSPDTIHSHIRHVEDYGTRYVYAPQVIKAGGWLIRRLAGFAYSDTLCQPIEIPIPTGGGTMVIPGNMVAKKQGLTRPEVIIVVGGHYDSICNMAPGLAAPGADDNASGTAAVLEIARLLADVELDATLQLVLFSSEETGGYGSTEFVRRLVAKSVSPDKLFFINLDMIGYDSRDRRRIKVVADSPSQSLAELAARVGEAHLALWELTH